MSRFEKCHVIYDGCHSKHNKFERDVTYRNYTLCWFKVPVCSCFGAKTINLEMNVFILDWKSKKPDRNQIVKIKLHICGSSSSYMGNENGFPAKISCHIASFYVHVKSCDSYCTLSVSVPPPITCKAVCLKLSCSCTWPIHRVIHMQSIQDTYFNFSNSLKCLNHSLWLQSQSPSVAI